MLTTDSQIDALRNSRTEKLALTVLIGLMRDSLPEAITRLEELIPQFKDMEEKSRRLRYARNKKPRLDIDHDIALKIRDLAEEILPWIKNVADLEKEDDIIGLA